MTIRCLLPGLLLVLLAPRPAPAQGSLSGHVVDTGDRAVSGARVTLVSAAGGVVREAATSDAGWFRFDSLAAGPYGVHIAHPGYRDGEVRRLEVRSGEMVHVALTLSASPVVLAPVEVVSRRRLRSAVLEGFYDRMEMGLGNFLGREQILARNAGSLSDLLRSLPGVRIGRNRFGARQVYFGRTLPRSDGCPVQVFLDGILMNRAPPSAMGADRSGRFELADNAVDVDVLAVPSDLEGIEVYAGVGTTPAEFMGPNARCGTVAVWSRRH